MKKLIIAAVIFSSCSKQLDKGVIIQREYKPEYIQGFHPKSHTPPGRIDARYCILVKGKVGNDSLTEWRYLNPYQYRQYKINDTIEFIKK